MKNKLIYFSIIILFLMSFTSAAISDLGTFKQDECIELPQSCTSCTYNNISKILYPNSSIALGEAAMTKDGNEYNYTFCNTSALGEYVINGHGDLDGTDTIWNYGFAVSYTGKELSSASSTFYIILFAIFIFLFIITILGINKLPTSNATDEEGIIIKISYLKYLRSILWFVLWMFIVAILYISSNLGFAYLEDTLVANFLFTLFRISFGLTLPMVVVWFVWIFVKIFDDKKIKKMWEKGFFQQRVI